MVEVLLAIAPALGARRRNDADAPARHVLLIAVVFALVFMAVMVVAGGRLALHPHGRQRRGAGCGTGLFKLGVRRRSAGLAVQDAVGRDPWQPADGLAGGIATVAGAVLPRPLSPRPIFGRGPLPGLGIAGRHCAAAVLPGRQCGVGGLPPVAWQFAAAIAARPAVTVGTCSAEHFGAWAWRA